MSLMKVFFMKKHVTLFLVFWKWRNNFAKWVYFCVHLLFHWADIVIKVLLKVGVWKNDKKGGDHYKGVVVYRRKGGSNLLHTMFIHWHFWVLCLRWKLKRWVAQFVTSNIIKYENFLQINSLLYYLSIFWMFLVSGIKDSTHDKIPHLYLKK